MIWTGRGCRHTRYLRLTRLDRKGLSVSTSVVVKRTLRGNLLTVMLYIMYVASILVLFALLSSWILRGAESPLVIVGLTLALALLLHPIRRGLQQLINRRYTARS